MDWSFWIFFLVIFAHVMVCPFSKVEESFYLQAAHDFIYLKNISKFDHHEFPGVVPRTAVPVYLTTLVVKPLAAFTDAEFKPTMQVLVRCLIGAFTALSLSKLTSIVGCLFGRSCSFFFILITVSQPHLLFYSSRTLPNSFALPLVLLALSYYPLQNRSGAFIQLSAFLILTIRCELALLMGSFLILGLITKQIPIFKLAVTGALVSFVSLAFTIPFDSYFWQYSIWPEGKVFHFNAVEGQSSAWGVSPFSWYFKSALPRACLTSLIFIPIGFLKEKIASWRIVAPVMMFIFIYSFNPHKELRFIMYVVPMLNIVSAIGFDLMYQLRSRNLFWKFCWLCCICCICVNFVGTCVFVGISSLNYPGGQALEKLHKSVPCSIPVSVHITNLAAQTGVTRFGQMCDDWIYDKTENLSTDEILDRDYSHLIAENHEKTIHAFSEKYRMLGVVDQYSHIKISPMPPSVQFKEALVILERRDFVEIIPKENVYEENWIRTSDEL